MNMKYNLYDNEWLILGGTPKCGTTSLAEYLGYCDEICVSSPKEPFHFGSDFTKLSTYIGSEDISRFFSHMKNEKILCDASTGYIYSEQSLLDIKSKLQKVKLVFVFRNPFEVLPAWYDELIYSFNEDANSLSEAIELEKIRNNGSNIPPSNKAEIFLQYSKVIAYGTNLDFAFRTFGKDNIHVILFEDLISGRFIEPLSKFIGINLPNLPLPKSNERKRHRFKNLSNFIYNPPICASYVYGVRRYFAQNRNKNVEWIKSKLKAQNTDKSTFDITNESFLKHITAEIKIFEKLINEETGWCK